MSWRLALYLLGTPLLHLEVGRETEAELEDEDLGSALSGDPVESAPVALGFSVTPTPALEPADWDDED